jgi:hypothetical protein
MAFLPMTVVLMVANIIASRLITSLGARPLLVFGLLLAATGYAANRGSRYASVAQLDKARDPTRRQQGVGDLALGD